MILHIQTLTRVSNLSQFGMATGDKTQSRKRERVEELATEWFRRERGEGLSMSLASSAEEVAAWRCRHIERLWFAESDEDQVRDCLSILELRNGQRGVGVGASAVVEALKRRLEQAIPTLTETQRKLLLEASLPFVAIGPLRSVPLLVLDSFAIVPSKAAQALDELPESAFLEMPRRTRLKLCAVSAKRFSGMWKPLVERWRARVLHRAEARLASSAQRKALDASLYKELRALAAAAPEQCVKACCDGKEPTLLVDVLLLHQQLPKSLARARRLAIALDAPLVAGLWTEAGIVKARAAAIAGPAAPMESCMHALQIADPDNVFARAPLEVSGYASVIKVPMDLVTMRAKRYTTLDEMEKDVDLIVSNCVNFNGADSQLAAQARKFRDAWTRARQQQEHWPVEAAACALLLTEPLAGHLALRDLADELQDIVHKRRLPLDSTKCTSLIQLIHLFDIAADSKHSHAHSTPLEELRFKLPKLAVALWRAKRHKRAKKHATKQPLLAALTGDLQTDNTSSINDGQVEDGANKDEKQQDTVLEHLQNDEQALISRKLAAHLAPRINSISSF